MGDEWDAALAQEAGDLGEAAGAGLVAAGGWTAPSDVVYALSGHSPVPVLEFPAISVTRGRMDFTDRRTDAEKAAHDAYEAWLRREVDRLARLRHDAIDAACVTALTHGWDVHVYDPPTVYDLRSSVVTRTPTAQIDQQVLYLRCVGIEFTPAEHPLPTIHRHASPTWWDDDE